MANQHTWNLVVPAPIWLTERLHVSVHTSWANLGAVFAFPLGRKAERSFDVRSNLSGNLFSFPGGAWIEKGSIVGKQRMVLEEVLEISPKTDRRRLVKPLKAAWNGSVEALASTAKEVA